LFSINRTAISSRVTQYCALGNTLQAKHTRRLFIVTTILVNSDRRPPHGMQQHRSVHCLGKCRGMCPQHNHHHTATCPAAQVVSNAHRCSHHVCMCLCCMLTPQPRGGWECPVCTSCCRTVCPLLSGSSWPQAHITHHCIKHACWCLLGTAPWASSRAAQTTNFHNPIL